MKKIAKNSRGGVLLLALILAVNILIPASAWAAPDPGCVDISIDGKNYLVYQPDGWEWVYNFPTKEEVYGSYYVPDISFDSEDHVIYKGKYLTLDGTTPVVKTDAINSGDAYTTMAIPLDFTAPESLSMRATQGSSELTIDPCVITNNGSENLKLSQVEITAASGWTVVNASTDFTTADSKNKIAFTAGGHDFASGTYAPGETIAAGSNTTLQLAGKISEKADLTNATQVASMVVTVEKTVTLISFTIADADVGTVAGTYSTEQGMTWEEFINSSYNSDGDFTVANDTNVKYKWTAGGKTVVDKVLLTEEIREGTEYLYGPSGIVYDPDKSL